MQKHTMRAPPQIDFGRFNAIFFLPVKWFRSLFSIFLSSILILVPSQSVSLSAG
jgi:hypothetical protein